MALARVSEVICCKVNTSVAASTEDSVGCIFASICQIVVLLLADHQSGSVMPQKGKRFKGSCTQIVISELLRYDPRLLLGLYGNDINPAREPRKVKMFFVLPSPVPT